MVEPSKNRYWSSIGETIKKTPNTIYKVFWFIHTLQERANNGCLHRKFYATYVSIESFISRTFIYGPSKSQEAFNFYNVVIISIFLLRFMVKCQKRFTEDNSGYLASTLWMFSLILQVLGIVSSGLGYSIICHKGKMHIFPILRILSKLFPQWQA